MSKGNMLLGHARGKVGSLVFSRSNGQQIVRSRAEVVRNPQTQQQMIQRIILQTISQAYSKMQPIVDHSFEGVAKGQKTMSLFMRRNMEMLRNHVATQLASGAQFSEIFSFSPLKSNLFAPNDYVVSKGTLPEIAVIDAADDGKLAIALGANTYQSLCDTYGVQRGDQLTFIGVSGASAATLQFSYARVIIDPTNNNGETLPLSTALVTDGAITSPSARNEGTFASLAFDTDKLLFGFPGTYLVCAAVIVSRKKADGTWLRSNASMKKNESTEEGMNSLEDCLNALVNSGITTPSEIYLNNAGVTSSAADDEGGDDSDPLPGGA